MKKYILGAALVLTVLGSLPAFADSVAYTYDAQGRLKAVVFQNGTTITYTYDKEGNRTSVTTTCSASGC
ncbi:RHS repeat protein [Scytonema tolypothrichoides VB-61278]|nr:RHS repeat protein [Scytonema tolypothrichoides VB-61278]